MRGGWLLACAAVLLTSGCVTPAAVEGLESVGKVGRKTYRYEAAEVIQAVRTGDGAYHVRVRFENGAKRNLVHEPMAEAPSSRRPRRIDGGDASDCAPYLDDDPDDWPSMAEDPARAPPSDPREDWPQVSTNSRVTFSHEDLPSDGVPLAIGNGGGSPGLPCVRVRDGYLERCQGAGYERVGRTPRIKRRERTWVTYLAEGAYATVVLPLAVATDIALGAAYVLAHCK